MKILRIALILICVLPQVSAVLFQKELFPWSHFPMYSGLNSGSDLSLISSYVIDQENNFVPIEKAIEQRPKYEYRWRVKAHQLQQRDINESEKQIFERFAQIFSEDLKNTDAKNKYKKILFVLENWKHFEASRRFNPDERKVLLEHSL